MSSNDAEKVAVIEEFLISFGFQKVGLENACQVLLSNRPPDWKSSGEFVDHFIRKCEKSDPTLKNSKLRKSVDSWMNESCEMTLMMEFLVRCRQEHLFRAGSDKPNSSFASGATNSSTPSVGSNSPFVRRSASRGRVSSTLTGEQYHTPANASSITSRSRANSSFTSYDNQIERQRSPYRMTAGIPTTRMSPLTASNELFSAPSNNRNYSHSSQFRGSTPITHHMAAAARLREDSPSQMMFRQPPQQHTSVPITSSIRAPQSQSNTPLHSRLGNAITETEENVCKFLLDALVGIESPIFARTHHEMTIKSTASISTTHRAVCQRVLSIANNFLKLSAKEPPHHTHGTVTVALLAAIRAILGNYIADMDGLRREKRLEFVLCLPLIDRWQTKLQFVVMAHKQRNLPQLELLNSLFILHSAHKSPEDQVLDKMLEYTMGVFCNQMMEWMTTGEIPTDKWIIGTDAQTGEMVLREIPIFMSDTDARILLEIGKSLPHVESASDDDLESIDKATTVVRAALSPKLIFDMELTPILKILRDVVCGIVMRMVITTGRLKDHIRKATSFFFLKDPRFTTTLYNRIKEASMGLRVGSAALSRQTVSSALASALEAISDADNNKKQKLKFTLDAMTSLGSTPNVSSKMQFVQPLSPHYEPQMDLMKPIFAACDADYESIFHVIWSIDLARYSTQEVATSNLPGMMRFLIKNYGLKENATCLVSMISHVFLVLNATLLRLRAIIEVQLEQHLLRLFAAIDEKCVDVDDVIREHLKFVRRVSVVVFVRNNEKIEHELATLLRIAFDAQEFAEEFCATWNEVIDATTEDENARKAQVAEICQKRTMKARMLMESVNKTHKTLSDLIGEQIIYGNIALID